MSSYRGDDPDFIGAAGFIFQTPVRARRGIPPDLPTNPIKRVRRIKALRRMAMASIRRAAGKSPQVMVKVSGKTKGRRHLSEHLAYITRNGKLIAEVSDSSNGGDASILTGLEGVRELAAEWYARNGDRKTNSRETINIVLSMPPHVDRDLMAKAASAFARAEFGGKFDYVLVHHTDTDHPHAHLTVRSRNDRGQYLDPKKADLQAWREGFAARLRQVGVDADASPRRSRGIVMKGSPKMRPHLDAGQRSRKTKANILAAIQTVRTEKNGKAPDEPWRNAIENRQKKVRAAWRTLAGELDKQGDIALAMQVRGFIEQMPALATRQDLLVQKIRGNPELVARIEKSLGTEAEIKAKTHKADQDRGQSPKGPRRK